LTIAICRAPGSKRWVIPRQGRGCGGRRGGLLALEEACSRDTLTVDESLGLAYSIDQHGSPAWRTTAHPAVPERLS